MKTSLTRRYHFSASHRLHVPGLGDAENARLFGKCNNPYGHGHDYTLEVTIGGSVNPATGLLLPVSQLDALVEQKVLRLFAFRYLNMDVPQFATRTATTENVVLVIAELLEQAWPQEFGQTQARLARIHVQETDRNSFEVLLPVSAPLSNPAIESALTHA